MNPIDDLDRRIAAELDDQLARRAPVDLLDRVEDSTRRQRQRPAWLAASLGHHFSSTTLPGTVRPGRNRSMNGMLRVVMAVAAVVGVAAVGLSVLAPSREAPLGGTGTGDTRTSLPTVSPSASGSLDRVSSTRFVPALTVDLPAGWSTTEDIRTMDLSGPTGGAIHLFGASVLGSNTADCGGLADEGAPRSADGLTAALQSDPRFEISDARPITVDGGQGFAFDVGIAPTWTQTCEWSSGKPAGLLVTVAEPPGPFVGLSGDERLRVVLLDVGDDLVWIVGDPGVKAVMDGVVESLHFTQ